jgi:mono/diheme cytochrome c family protein
MKMVVIADDLTGAAEVAGAAIRWGLSAEVHIGELHHSSADVIVVDADSRSLTAVAAYARVAELTRQSLLLNVDLLFKKVDSLLRGAVLAELSAMQTAANYQQSLLLCANPRKQRCVRDGLLFVDRQAVQDTDFAFDPEHPRHTSDVCELLRRGSEVAETSVDARDENGVWDDVHVVSPGHWSSARLLVGNAANSDDLDVHLTHWLSHRQSTLIAGGAECFEALVRLFAVNETTPLKDQSLLDDGDVLLISGSRLTQLKGWPVVVCDQSRSACMSAAQVCQTLARCGRAAIRAVDIESGSPTSRIDQIVDIARRVLATCRPSQVWIEGGHAASTMIRRLDYQRLVALFNAGDGIVALRAIDESSPVYLLKPGSYPWTCRQKSPMLPVATKTTDLETQTIPVAVALAKKFCFLLAAFGLTLPTLAAEPVVPKFDVPKFDRVTQIVAENCLDCHNAQSQEGTVNLERFKSLSDFDGDRPLWKSVFDVVEAGQMPLPQSGYELTESQRLELLTFIKYSLARPDPELKARDPGKPVLRRLTRLEYNNTVRDLFGLHYDVFMFPERLPVADKRYFTTHQSSVDASSPGTSSLGNVVQTSMREYGQKYDVLLPQLGLPGDNRAEYGYSNRGDALNFSPLLFEKYLQLSAAIAHSERLLQDSVVMQELLGVQPPPAVVEPPADRVETFLRRAYRRQVSQEEKTSAMAFVAARIAGGDSQAEALRRLVQAVLTSPQFLFLAETVNDSQEPVRALRSDELANRLSYFLWSSMPDKELLAVADSGSLNEPSILRREVRRMLADRSRIRELSESFAVQWLRLDQLYSSKPDRELFKKFYSGPQGKSTLHGPMMTEALLLFETVLVEDLSILHLYDSSFTWLNVQLAKHYGLEDAYRLAQLSAVANGAIPELLPEKGGGNYWLRTTLPDRTRGGVMTMAGPLTLTSLPFRTSPIKRGAWLLETVFNRPPAEPKVAFVLEQAIAEPSSQSQARELPAKTVRQLFEKHRSDPNCYSCHSRIDPPGFSLEVFDAMGRLRTHDGEQLVDASGTWNGHDFTTPVEFKDAMRVREDELTRGFVEHLLSYALGRELEHFDMQAVDQIVAAAADQDYRMSAIVEGVALSYPFQHVRNKP